MFLAWTSLLLKHADFPLCLVIVSQSLNVLKSENRRQHCLRGILRRHCGAKAGQRLEWILMICSTALAIRFLHLGDEVAVDPAYFPAANI